MVRQSFLRSVPLMKPRTMCALGVYWLVAGKAKWKSWFREKSRVAFTVLAGIVTAAMLIVGFSTVRLLRDAAAPTPIALV